MQFDHSFTVAAGIDETWRLLLDVERSGGCLPGAVIESIDGDRVSGSVRVKLGPLNLTYAGTVTFVEKDEAARRIVLAADGHDARTDSSATMRVTATLSESDAATTVALHSELDVTGKPAQFNRAVMNDVGTKMVAQFAESLGHVIDGTAVPAKAAKKTATRKTAKKAVAKKAAATKKAAAKTAKKTAAAKKVAAKTTASVPEPGSPQADEDTPSFAAPGGIPPAPTLEDRPSVNGHTGSGPGVSPAQHSDPARRPLQVALPTLVKRVAPVLGPAAVGLVIVLVVQHRRRTHH